ncbi:MAG TPA: Ig-like domain-containing protein, partial [Candidatus Dormibacteraeota bacterium]|nr:Ig-like domain-containing protein [Candidatus Dormibacteraeota bacterium]
MPGMLNSLLPRSLHGLSWCLWALLIPPVLAENSAILPLKFELRGPAARQQLLLEQKRDNQFAGQITNEVTFTSSDPKVLRIEGDVALPVTNGAATVTAKSRDISATAEVVVAGMEHPFQWSFRNHVQPVLAKM